MSASIDPASAQRTDPDVVRRASIQLAAQGATVHGTVHAPADDDAVTLAFATANPPGETEPSPSNDGPGPAVVLGSVLGRGGMGIVHLGRQASMARDVAVKRVRSDAERPNAHAQLLREALITGALEHPNIVPVYDLARDEAHLPLLVMKRIEGRSWEAALRRAPELRAGEWLETQLRVLMAVCDAVRFAHSRGIVHRDLKPENVMLGHFGEVLVVDWGIAVSTDAAHQGRFPLAKDCTHIAGTPAYMAPEQVAADGANIGPRTDVYLLGGITFELLTGAAPHEAEHVHASLFSAHESKPPVLPADVPAPLAEICRIAMARNPEDRFPDVAHLRDAVAAYLLHRTSIEITERALKDTAILMATPPAEDNPTSAVIDPLGVHKRFVRAKFGFQQALDIWPENWRASRGLQSVLELMIRRSMAAGELGQAGLLLEELPAPAPTLSADLAASRVQQSEDQAGLARLGALGQRHDLRVGTLQRRWFTFALMLIWPGLSALTHYWQVQGTLTGGRHALVAGIFLALVMLYAVVRHRHIRRMGLNQRFFHIAGLSTVSLFAIRLFAWMGGLPPAHVQPAELIVFFMGMGAIAAVGWRYLILPATLYAVGAALAAVNHEQAFIISGVVHFAALGTNLWMWERVRDRSAKG
ncbi:MAG: serine/threonine protein kinase [Myxococcales bacterium]|nr:serine/threonine protein kinase [Myxococcales bacterium]